MNVILAEIGRDIAKHLCKLRIAVTPIAVKASLPVTFSLADYKTLSYKREVQNGSN